MKHGRICSAGGSMTFLPLTLWRRIPPGLRPYLMIEPLRLGLPKARQPMPPPDAPLYVAGFFHAPTGLGESARLFFQETKQTGKEVYAIDLTQLLRSDALPALHNDHLLLPESFGVHAGPGTLVIHVNPPAYMLVLWLLRGLLPGKRLAAYWAWELEDIPHFWTRCLEHVDEVLVPSSFTAGAVRRHTRKPVQVHPHAVSVPKPEYSPVVPAGVGKFRVLIAFDMGSNFYRKNPLAAVAAFQKAFGDNNDVELLVKTSGVERRRHEWELLQQNAARTGNVRFIHARLTAGEMAALYTLSAVYLSLHRSEGYGLTVREAMLHGLHVVATGWSGNMDFMRGERCHPVPYSLVPVRDPQGTYKVAGTVWAEPDITAAAAILRRLAANFRTKQSYCYS